MISPCVIRLDSDGGEYARYDVARFAPSTKRTPQGFLVAPATFTKSGVFEYTRMDGSKVRELRPEDEVFATASLETLKNIPLIRDDHPPGGLITPQNAKKYAVGWGSERVERQDSFVAGQLTIMDGKTIEDAEQGTLKEISMGYRCKIDFTSGEHPIHGRYDQIQRNIRYNHAALGGNDWGRAGENVGLRLDDKGAVCLRTDSTQIEYLVMQLADLHGWDRFELAKKSGLDLFLLGNILYGYEIPKKADLQKLAKVLGVDVEILIGLVSRVDRADKRTTMETEKIIINGVEFEVSKSAAQAIRNDSKIRDSQIAELKSDFEKLQGRFDAQSEELKRTKDQLVETQDPKRLDSLVEEKIDLIAKAKKVLGDEEIKGSKREIMEQVLRKDSKDLDLAEKSDDYVEARFDAFIDLWKKPKDLTSFRQDAFQSQMSPGSDKRTAEQARQEMLERNRNAWKNEK